MPEDRTPIDHGLTHAQPERGRIPQPKPQADEDQSELVNNQRTVSEQAEEAARDGKDGLPRQPD